VARSVHCLESVLTEVANVSNYLIQLPDSFFRVVYTPSLCSRSWSLKSSQK